MTTLTEAPSSILKRGTRGKKLDAEQVRAILKSSEPGTMLAERYSVSGATISYIRHGKRWKIIA